ncbi:MAG TPA: M23 family metallopeptidase [Candidatus Acidoferrales bacterium]|nr:M23 family metallopeptidase [Candidatus Acidoferrales bacterium]
MTQSVSAIMNCLGRSRFSRIFLRNPLLFVVICLPFAFSAGLRAQQTTPTIDISDSWTGVLGTGANQLHLVITFAKLSNGDYSGQVNSVDQGAVLPCSSVTVQGQKIHFEIAQIGGVYEGTLSDDQKQITGTWTQASTPPQPLNLTRSATSAPSSTNSSAAAPGPKQKPISLPLDVTVPIAPMAFKADGKLHLVYELHIVNMSPWNCSLTRVEVLAANSSNSLASFSGAALDSMLQRPGVTALPKSRLTPGTEAVVFLWITVDSKADVPASIRHRVSVMLGDYPDELSVETNPLAVHTGPIVISPPLRGDHWLAANGPSNTSGHRRALIPINGHAVISQRFAIDWVKLGDDGQTYHGDKLDNKNYYAFGSDALAVADGIVTEVKDGIPLNVPGIDSRAVPITLETVGGNHVILNIGNGCYAFYAHLQPGSIRVKVGDHLHRGQVLGLVGNTGNSTEPHLHFHISNASSPLGSEGLPYLFSSFEVEGKGFGWKPSEAKDAPEKHTMELPTENEVVRFPSQP